MTIYRNSHGLLTIPSFCRRERSVVGGSPRSSAAPAYYCDRALLALATVVSLIATPILLTGLASCIGFGVPMLTSQPALRNFGLVMDLSIIAAVGSCLFLLPVLARLPTRSRGRSAQSPGESR